MKPNPRIEFSCTLLESKCEQCDKIKHQMSGIFNDSACMADDKTMGSIRPHSSAVVGNVYKLWFNGHWIDLKRVQRIDPRFHILLPAERNPVGPKEMPTPKDHAAAVTLPGAERRTAEPQEKTGEKTLPDGVFAVTTSAKALIDKYGFNVSDIEMKNPKKMTRFDVNSHIKKMKKND